MFSWMTPLFVCATLCASQDHLVSCETLLDYLEQLDAQPVSPEQTAAFEALWARLQADQQIPFRLGGDALFLFREDPGHPPNAVAWPGDFNNWHLRATDLGGGGPVRPEPTSKAG